MLRRYVPDPSHVLRHGVLYIDPQASYEEEPSRILDHKDKELRNMIIPMVKVQWGNHTEEEVTWETESAMREKCPHLF